VTGTCIEQCVDQVDCLIAGNDAGFDCIDGRCQPSNAPCTSDAQCTADASFWSFISCTADSDCFVDGVVCIDLDGAGGGTDGGCAALADGGCQAGEALPAVTVLGVDVQVCGEPSKCDDLGACVPDDGCAVDADCTEPNLGQCVGGTCVACEIAEDCVGNPNGTTCYADGSCGCSDDSECNGGLSHCDIVEGDCECAGGSECDANEQCVTGGPTGNYCGCANDAACNGAFIGDACDVVFGRCGCADVDDCGTPLLFDNTAHACVEL
jgi:hypothetical protein